jgi:Glycosyl hydrolases family 18
VYQDVTAILSVGGWSGSQFFSSAVATDANRTAFAEAILNVVGTYNLDGLEFECVSFNLSKVFTHWFIVGNIPLNKALVATSYPRVTPPTSFCFCKRFVGRHRNLSCLLRSRSPPLSAPMVTPCQASPDLRKSSTTSVRFFSSSVFLTFF